MAQAAAISAEEWAQAQQTWNEWVKALLEVNFSKVTVIVRPHNLENGQAHPYAWSPLAYSAADCVATQWEKTDADGDKTMVYCILYAATCPHGIVVAILRRSTRTRNCSTTGDRRSIWRRTTRPRRSSTFSRRRTRFCVGSTRTARARSAPSWAAPKMRSWWPRSTRRCLW